MSGGKNVYWIGGVVGLGHGATHWIIAAFYFLLPFIKDDLGLSYLEAGAFATVFQIASFGANIFSGPLVDMTGRRVFWQVVSLLVGTAALFFVSQAMGYFGLVVALIFIGATNNLWHPAAIAYLSRLFKNRRGLALSFHALGANLGDALAPLILGPVLVLLSWRDTAAIAAIPAVLIAVLLVIALRDKETGDVAEVKHNAAVQDGKKVNGRDYLTGLGEMIKDKFVMTLCVMSAFRNMAQQGLLIFLPLYLVYDLNMSPEMMGFTLFAFQGAGILAAPIAGHWSDKIGRRPVVMSGLGISTALIIMLGFVSDPFLFVAGISVMGFGLFAIRPVVHSWMMDMTPDHMGGSATSLLFGCQSLLAMLSPIVGGWLADQYGLIAAFYFLGASMLIANLIVIFIPNRRSEA